MGRHRQRRHADGGREVTTQQLIDELRAAGHDVRPHYCGAAVGAYVVEETRHGDYVVSENGPKNLQTFSRWHFDSFKALVRFLNGHDEHA